LLVVLLWSAVRRSSWAVEAAVGALPVGN
jgi:hypothetical protein